MVNIFRYKKKKILNYVIDTYFKNYQAQLLPFGFATLHTFCKLMFYLINPIKTNLLNYVFFLLFNHIIFLNNHISKEVLIK